MKTNQFSGINISMKLKYFSKLVITIEYYKPFSGNVCNQENVLNVEPMIHMLLLMEPLLTSLEHLLFLKNNFIHSMTL